MSDWPSVPIVLALHAPTASKNERHVLQFTASTISAYDVCRRSMVHALVHPHWRVHRAELNRASVVARAVAICGGCDELFTFLVDMLFVDCCAPSCWWFISADLFHVQVDESQQLAAFLGHSIVDYSWLANIITGRGDATFSKLIYLNAQVGSAKLLLAYHGM